MALTLKDRVQQTGTANTTVSFTLSGSVSGFQSFAIIGNGNTTYYAATDTSGNWEVGLGTYSTTGPTLTRTTILSSSNSNTPVTFSGTVNVFVTYPAESVPSDATPTVAGIVYGKTLNVPVPCCLPDRAVALGYNAGLTSQGFCAVAIGPEAGKTSQSLLAIGVGSLAGTISQGFAAIAIGACAGKTCQGSAAIAIGQGAGFSLQAANSIAIGSFVAAPNAGLYISPIRNTTCAGTTCAVGLGYCTTSKEIVYGVGGGGGGTCATPTVAGIVYGQTTGACTFKTALGYNAGLTCQGACSVAIGKCAGAGSIVCCVPVGQGAGSVAIGLNAGKIGQTSLAVAVGKCAGQCAQGDSAIAVGYGAGGITQSGRAVAIGVYAGRTTQGQGSIGIGFRAGRDSQGACAVGIGYQAAITCQGSSSVAIGAYAGNCTQGASSVAIGPCAANTNQGANAVAIGKGAGSCTQGAGAIAIGNWPTGQYGQGANAIAIGTNAGVCYQAACSIAIGNFCGYFACLAAGFYVNPIRNITGGVYLGYDACTREITYSAGAPSDINLKENIQPIGCALNKTAQIRGVTFDWKKCGAPSIGVIAQELEQVFPEMVTLEGDGYKTVKYDNMVAVLVEAVKELKVRVEKLEALNK